MVAKAIVKNLHQKVFDEIMNRENIPTEFGSRKDLAKASEELQRTLKDRLMNARIKEEGDHCLYKIISILYLILYNETVCYKIQKQLVGLFIICPDM